MMLTIGQFAQVTALTITALRQYDRDGLLSPTKTDPVSGVRRYDATQISTGAQIGLLDAMKVPSDTIADYLHEPDSPIQVLQQHRERVLSERQPQDRLWNEAFEILADYRAGGQIQERQAAPLYWVGLLSPIGEHRTPDTSEEFIGHMLSILAEQRVRMCGPFWTAFRGDGETNPVVRVLATGIEDPLPAALADQAQLVSGLLPQRRELFVPVDSAAAKSQNLPGPHPAAVALLTAHKHGSLEDIRQVTVMPPNGEPYIEFVVDITNG